MPTSTTAGGERVGKALSTLATEYVYNENGHLIGEYDGTGALQTEYIYLDDQPIALNTGGSRYYIETDQLGTPRQAIDPVRNVAVWTWDPLASTFGTNAPNTDPDGDGIKIAVNLRFPGQYADAETAIYYNSRRDYDPSTGRYEESDPIGLEGGWNTYGYVNSNPLRYVDPRGLLIKGPSDDYPCKLIREQPLVNGPAGPLVSPAILFNLIFRYKIIACIYYCGPESTCPVNPNDYIHIEYLEAHDIIGLPRKHCKPHPVGGL